jgi:hypothetical protein
LKCVFHKIFKKPKEQTYFFSVLILRDLNIYIYFEYQFVTKTDYLGKTSFVNVDMEFIIKVKKWL